MYKGIVFDISLEKVRLHAKYEKEHEALHDFASSNHQNMLFEYDTNREACNSYAYLKKVVFEEKIPIVLSVHAKKNLLVRRKSKEC